jgi:uncharacterized protein (TIGR02145 family)
MNDRLKHNNQLNKTHMKIKAIAAFLIIPFFFLTACNKNKTTIPQLTTSDVTEITDVSAKCGGQVLSDGGSLVTSRGVCWSLSNNPSINDNNTVDGQGAGSFVSTITGLSANTTYYVRAYAMNEKGVAYGSIMSFTTLQGKTAPQLSTLAISSISNTDAVGGGVILNDGGEAITERGICWSTTHSPTKDENIVTDNGSNDSFMCSITGLTKNTTYYVRAFASNSVGTAYGQEVEFTTLNNITVTDLNGNVYQTIEVGNQIWMKENLRTTKYNDGTDIQLVSDASTWSNLFTGAYCYYDNLTANQDNYGNLYNFLSIESGKLCPQGWHVPSDTEWKELEMSVGMSSSDADQTGYRGTDEGGKLKATGYDLWKSPNTGASDAIDFGALPGGMRLSDSRFLFEGERGKYWTSTKYGGTKAYYRIMKYDEARISRDNYSDVRDGSSVRCVMDK